ncbi:MAG: imidazolonepropionase [Promethearchaeota archaeon]|nr:MAG: imidazolonepropionase [Candidatus Lokiarchaeota archaeon]
MENENLFILNIKQLITMDRKYGVPRIGENMTKLGIIKNGAIAVKNEKIDFVGTTKEIKARYELLKDSKVINAANKIVTPGFVDPHTHIIFAGSRERELKMKLDGKSYLEILESDGGILSTVRNTRSASKEDLIENGMKILNKMMEYGTTTIETKSGYGLTVKDELKSLRVIKALNQRHPIEIISTFLGAHAVPPEYKGKTQEYVDLIVDEMIPKIANEQLAQYCDVFCEKGIFSVEQTREILQTAINYRLKPIIHIDEMTDTNGAKLAAELDAIHVSHVLKSNKNGLRQLAKKRIVACLLPGTPFCSMMDHYAPAREMINLGIPIALATDLNPNCWTESMQFIMQLACYTMKLTPAEALTSSTLNAACAVQKEDQIGSLEVGNNADIIIFDVPTYHHLVYHFGINHVSKVIKNGEILFNII